MPVLMNPTKEEILKVSQNIESLRRDLAKRKKDYKHALECLDEISVQVRFGNSCLAVN